MLKAVLFDIDGTILDNEIYTITSKINEGKKLGYEITYDIAVKTLGLAKDISQKYYKDIYGEEFPYDLMRKYRSEYIIKALENNEIHFKKGFENLFNYLVRNNILVALVSSSSTSLINTYKSYFPLLNEVNCTISGDDIKLGKPHPDCFNLALERLNVKKEEALVIEDSLNGIKSAYNANIKSIFIEDLVKLNEEIKNHASYILNDLDEVIDLIKKLNKNC